MGQPGAALDQMITKSCMEFSSGPRPGYLVGFRTSCWRSSPLWLGRDDRSMFVHTPIFGQVQMLAHRIHLLALRHHPLSIQILAYFLVSLLSSTPRMRFGPRKSTELLVMSLSAYIDDGGFYVLSVFEMLALFFLHLCRIRHRRCMLREALVVNSAAM